MITRYIPFVLLTMTSLAFADAGYVGRMKSELPTGQYAGKKTACNVVVTADNSGEQSYTVAISKPGRNTTTFTLNDIDTLVDTDAQKPSYVGDPSGIAGIRTWLVKKQTSTKSSVSSLQIMVSSSGGWIIRSGTPGTVSCEISAQK